MNIALLYLEVRGTAAFGFIAYFYNHHSYRFDLALVDMFVFISTRCRPKSKGLLFRVVHDGRAVAGGTLSGLGFQRQLIIA